MHRGDLRHDTEQDGLGDNDEAQYNSGCGVLPKSEPVI